MGAIIYWLMPLFFPQTGPKDLNKFLMYLILAVVREGVDTFERHRPDRHAGDNHASPC